MNSDLDALRDQNLMLTQEIRRHANQLAAVNRVSAAVSGSLSLNEVMETALQVVLNTTGAQASGISLIDEEAQELVLRAQKGWLQDFVRERPMRIPLGRGLSGWVIENDDVLVHNDLDERQELAVSSFHEEKFRSIAMAPMHARGKIIGILSIMSYKPFSFDMGHVDVLQNVADTVGVSIDNARLYEASYESQSRLRAVLQSTADGIIATSRDGRIRMLNAAAENMLDVPAALLNGVPLRECPLPQHIRESLLFAVSSSTTSAVNGSAVSNQTFRISTSHGRVLSVLVSPIAVESQVDPGLTDGWVIVLQDVTHLHEAELERSRFIQTAAHDMRNPLGAALSSLELLRRLLKTQADAVLEVIDVAKVSIQRIRALIDDLASLEKLQAGVDFTLSEVDIGELIQEVSSDLQPYLREKNLRYQVDFQSGMPFVYADRQWLLRALTNYLTNARQFAQQDGAISLRVFTNDSHLHFEVRDDGPGIPLENQSRLFERFYKARSTSGTGLGLAIVKTVAEAHGGHVYVKSDEGQGSTFGMTLFFAPAYKGD